MADAALGVLLVLFLAACAVILGGIVGNFIAWLAFGRDCRRTPPAGDAPTRTTKELEHMPRTHMHAPAVPYASRRPLTSPAMPRIVPPILPRVDARATPNPRAQKPLDVTRIQAHNDRQAK